MAIVLLLLLAAGPGPAPVGAADARNTDGLGRDYYLYAPARIDRNKSYWLVVGVHGYGGDGQGAAGLADWAQRGDCIVVGPSFPNEGYQLLQQRADEQLEKLFADLKAKYPLQPRLFLYGFSGGAQFAHRFMLKYPELVAGCAAHSGGSWATGQQWGEINPKAADVPLVISCGRTDTAKMHPEAPYGRLEWCQKFESMLAEKDFLFAAGYWQGAGHQYTPGARAMTLECYGLATQQMPEAARAREGIGKLIEEQKHAAALQGIARSRVRVPANAGGGGAGATLVQKAAMRHNAQLDALLARVEEAGLAKVKTLAEAPAGGAAAAERAKALMEMRKILADFRGAPKTTAAAQEAIKVMTSAKGTGQ